MLRVTCWTMLLLFSWAACAQTSTKSADTEQIQREMLKEIKLLRADLLRVSVNANRAQMLLARVRGEQEQVIRITSEIGDVHEKLYANREQQQKKNAELADVQRAVEVELRPEGDATAVKNEISALQNREQSLMQRESELSGELNEAQSMLSTLNARLDDIDRDMANTAGAASRVGAR